MAGFLLTEGHCGFLALLSSHPKLLCNADSVVVPNGKHPSAMKYFQSTSSITGWQTGWGHPTIKIFEMSFHSFLIPPSITEHVKPESVAGSFESECIWLYFCIFLPALPHAEIGSAEFLFGALASVLMCISTDGLIRHHV